MDGDEDIQVVVRQLSDDDLAKRLRDEFGYRAGPITATTRSIYEKKLVSLISDKSPKLVKASVTSATSQNGTNGPSTSRGDSPRRSGRKSLPTPQKGQSKFSEHLSPLDESREFVTTITPKRTRTNEEEESDYELRVSTRKSNRRVTIASDMTPKESTPTIKNTRRISGFTPRALDLDGSSDEDEGHSSPKNNGQTGKRVVHNDSPWPLRNPSTGRALPIPPITGLLPDVRPRYSNEKNSPTHRPLIRPSSLTNEENSLIPSLANFSDSETEEAVSPISVSIPVVPSSSNPTRHPPNLHLRKRSSRMPNRPSGYSSNVVTQVTYDDRPSSSSLGSYNWISLSILVASCIFFVSIFAYYLLNSYHEAKMSGPSIIPDVAMNHEKLERQRIHEAEAELIGKLNKPICGQVLTRSSPGTPPGLCFADLSDIKPALRVVKEIQSMFQDRVVDHFCQSEDWTDNPEVLNLRSIKDKLVHHFMDSPDFPVTQSAKESGVADDQKLSQIHKAIADAVTLIQLNPTRFKMAVQSDFGGDAIHINARNFPISWPIGCRLRLGFWQALFQVGVMAGVLALAWAGYSLVAARRRRLFEEESLFYELLEKSLELLQSPDEPGSMPVIHIRDTILTPSDKKDHPNILRIWEKVVRQIEESESRVKVGFGEIEGETFKTWKWVCPVPMDGGSPSASSSPSASTKEPILRTGSIVWQGQAFNEANRRGSTMGGAANKRLSSPSIHRTDEDFVAPTPFLKVRNMFDEETVASAKGSNDSYWKVNITNAIIEKCQMRADEIGRRNHGLCHVFVDESHAGEGLVYIKCTDIGSASSAYLSLHGWWCQGKLVSVRFLKDDKYYSRFPEARNMKTTLSVEGVVDVE